MVEMYIIMVTYLNTFDEWLKIFKIKSIQNFIY